MSEVKCPECQGTGKYTVTVRDDCCRVVFKKELVCLVCSERKAEENK